MRQFLADHPDGAIDMLQVALCCPACHSVSSRLDLSMYLPVDSSVKPQDGKSWACYHPENAGYMYVNPYDLENPKLYRLFALYEHKCEKCGHQMEIIKGKDFIRLRNECMKENKPSPFKCRRCGEDLWFTNEEKDWD